MAGLRLLGGMQMINEDIKVIAAIKEKYLESNISMIDLLNTEYKDDWENGICNCVRKLFL